MNKSVCTNCRQLVWKATRISGVFAKTLRRDKESGAATVLIKFDPGTHFPAHSHPGGEEVLVLEGSVQIGQERLGPGGYLYTPPGKAHTASTESGAVLLITAPKPIEIIPA